MAVPDKNFVETIMSESDLKELQVQISAIDDQSAELAKQKAALEKRLLDFTLECRRGRMRIKRELLCDHAFFSLQMANEKTTKRGYETWKTLCSTDTAEGMSGALASMVKDLAGVSYDFSRKVLQKSITDSLRVWESVDAGAQEAGNG